ncbi:2,3-dihydro-2,3-dihydroxybenzoate dehydrogenase [Amycolatopsis alba]|uniref:2,3-dihydro-2,3-dihydroxybenzoate dehydrogenase n=1 Tax=Amycolatopsis alba DSM 44262 TaxID=1125972 RepID=A0A229S2H0_AMYAL|nr:2,3-dihydro-2,3-dihydroxybenzoate dehydrogenase [Amycolatopsis alba]OXM53098.1 2,3-dihydro-2,3-dihydroxybenzoate dehydrogenase [Amycolatopsis alba DSM 44262]
MPGVEISGVSGESVVVTGAARGIGRAVAHAFAEAGARVALWDRDQAVETAASELRAAEDTRTVAVRADVSDPADVRKAFDHSESVHGDVAVVVHAAGVLRTGSALGMSDEDWQECLSVNATGTMLVAAEAARRMAPRGRGAITVIASNAAATPRIGMAAYCASKAAAAAFTRSLGLEVAGRGVRCNIVSPGSTDTAMLRESWTGDADFASTLAGDPAAFRLGIPLARIATPDDVARAALFLSSDAARHITLHDLRVDGGATLDL